LSYAKQAALFNSAINKQRSHTILSTTKSLFLPYALILGFSSDKWPELVVFVGDIADGIKNPQSW